MKSLANADEKRVLARIQNDAQTYGLTIGETWTLFSWIKKTHKFERRLPALPVDIGFTADEVKHLKSIKLKVRAELERSTSRRCAYCKRGMGNYGYSWQIEHIRCKNKHHALTFELKNLTLACIDCNSAKGKSVDKSNPYLYNIIDPNATGFKYGSHLRFFYLATEDFCFMKYRCITVQGTATYNGLKLNVWERAETLKSISAPHQEVNARLDRILDMLSNDDRFSQVTQLLAELKILAFEK